MSTSNRVPLSPGFFTRGGTPGTKYHIRGGLFAASRLRARMNAADGPAFAAAAGYTQTRTTSYDVPAAAPQPLKRSLDAADIIAGYAILPSPTAKTHDEIPALEETPKSPAWASFCRINPINIPPPSPVVSSFPHDVRNNASAAPLISAAPTTRAFSTNSSGKAPSPKAAKNERQNKAKRFAPYDLCFRPKKQVHTEAPVTKAPNLEQYHELADAYMESMLAVLDSIAEQYPSWDLDYN
ncbi:MAG: hypothetical protein Q9191_002685, partial [Dirinaria sp. TL-2023a]